MQNIEGLKGYLRENIAIEEVWFNEKGQWCFSPTTVFTIHKTRDEVLKDSFEKDFAKSDAAQVSEGDETITDKIKPKK